MLSENILKIIGGNEYSDGVNAFKLLCSAMFFAVFAVPFLKRHPPEEYHITGTDNRLHMRYNANDLIDTVLFLYH